MSCHDRQGNSERSVNYVVEGMHGTCDYTARNEELIYYTCLCVCKPCCNVIILRCVSGNLTLHFYQVFVVGIGVLISLSKVLRRLWFVMYFRVYGDSDISGKL